jgi:oxygen-independent coproporphyrinogen-3 oxidase
VDLGLKRNYLDALRKEVEFHYEGELLQTIYFGGGTPSLLEVGEIERIINLLSSNHGSTEITLELNPDGLGEEYLNGLKKIGVNRLSFGAQTFDDDILKLIGRRHNPQDVENAVKSAQKAGFYNISLDFIYGLPAQSVEGFAQDLCRAAALGVQHISLYGLKIEEGCYFYSSPPQNLPDEDLQADMYLKAVEILTANGFEHYEVSNFSLPGYASAHNLNYWDNNTYYGFGVAAHGYCKDAGENIRYSNTNDILKYLANPVKHENEARLTRQEQLEEEIFLGLRKTGGIDVKAINEKFGIDFDEKYADILLKYQKSEHIARISKGYRLTTNGILISNTVLSEFIQMV